MEYFMNVILGIGNLLKELILTQCPLAYFMLVFSLRSGSENMRTEMRGKKTVNT
jgi:hypothetical protein